MYSQQHTCNNISPRSCNTTPSTILKHTTILLLCVGSVGTLIITLFPISSASTQEHCIPAWQCETWSVCINGVATRDCVDTNSCSTTMTEEPDTQRSCYSGAAKSYNATRPILFDVSLELLETTVDSSVMSKMSLVNIGVPGQVNGTLTHTITAEDNSIVYHEVETVTVETQIEYIKSFDVTSFSNDYYTLTANLSYPGQVEPAYGEAQFRVNHQTFFNRYILSIIVLLLVLSIIFFSFGLFKQQ